LFFLSVYFLSQRVYPIPFEIGRLIKMLFAAAIIYMANLFMLEVNLITKILINLSFLAAFPVILYFLKFFKPNEFNSIVGFIRKWKNLSNLKDNITSIVNNSLED
jgi:hypothetical protein